MSYSDQPFKIQSEKRDDFTILHVFGDLTGESDKALGASFDEVAGHGKRLVIDFSNSDYVNSAGIASIISLLKRSKEAGLEMAMTGLNKHFSKVIETVGLNDFIDIYPNLKEFSSRLLK